MYRSKNFKRQDRHTIFDQQQFSVNNQSHFSYRFQPNYFFNKVSNCGYYKRHAENSNK